MIATNLSPIKCDYTKCIIYCHDIDPEIVDMMNLRISYNWENILNYIKPSIFTATGKTINKRYKNIVKYIVYMMVDESDTGHAVVVLKDGYHLIKDSHKTDKFVIIVDRNSVQCSW